MLSFERWWSKKVQYEHLSASPAGYNDRKCCNHIVPSILIEFRLFTPVCSWIPGTSGMERYENSWRSNSALPCSMPPDKCDIGIQIQPTAFLVRSFCGIGTGWCFASGQSVTGDDISLSPRVATELTVKWLPCLTVTRAHIGSIHCKARPATATCFLDEYQLMLIELYYDYRGCMLLKVSKRTIWSMTLSR